jgi:hypothetical protein
MEAVAVADEIFSAGFSGAGFVLQKQDLSARPALVARPPIFSRRVRGRRQTGEIRHNFSPKI